MHRLWRKTGGCLSPFVLRHGAVDVLNTCSVRIRPCRGYNVPHNKRWRGCCDGGGEELYRAFTRFSLHGMTRPQPRGRVRRWSLVSACVPACFVPGTKSHHTHPHTEPSHAQTSRLHNKEKKSLRLRRFEASRTRAPRLTSSSSP